MLETPERLPEETPRRWASYVAAMFALLLISIVLLLFRANDAREQAGKAERHTYDVLVATGSFETAVARAEASLGLFVVSGDPRDGTRYYDQWLKAGRLLNLVQQLTLDNPRQREAIVELRALYRKRGEELARPANLATYKRQWAAFNALDEEGATPTTMQMRRVLERIGEEERDRLATRRDHANSMTDWSNLLDTALAALGVMLIAAAGLLGWTAVRAIAARRDTERRVQEQRRHTAELQAAVAARTAELSAANTALRAEAGERAAAEAQLRQMQKMDAIGQLSGGIAHDFNNMLAVVIGGLDMARRRLSRETLEIERHIANAMEGANRAASLTQRLLAFARQQPLQLEGVAVGPMILGMSEMLSRALGELIEIEMEVGHNIWPVWTDPTQFESAILNLAVNARDAMPAGGRLLIRAENRPIRYSFAAGRGELSPGDYVVITVSDTGTGIPAEVVDRVLEPFFTTKDVGKGTGLGLSQIYGFVRQSGGELSIHSIEGEGTTITLFMPRHTGAVAAEPRVVPLPPLPARAAMPQFPAESKTVLVVEDEPRVRASTTSALEELGYRVVTAEDGDQALGLLADHPDIDLLLTDVVMPEMTGTELALAAREMRPDLHIMFTTGYSGNVEDAGGRGTELLGSSPILHKPFTINALEAKVREALDHRAAA
jgi:signal transduction histidine kinase/CheY-like chemotaxis protein